MLANRYPTRTSLWQLRSQSVTFGNRPVLMGIVNVTPDSFSDGGTFFQPELAVEHALKLADDGADILDIGGESTRPQASPVSVEEELRRISPVISALARQTNIPISIDTSKSVVARAALDLGAEIVNDVTGLQGDPFMQSLIVKERPGVCIMHMQGTPQTMQSNPQYENVVREVSQYLKQRRDDLMAAGVPRSQICLDPGIGFGKTHQHNLVLVHHADEFHEHGCPILIGHSRKGFIGRILRAPERDRLAGTIGISLVLAQKGIQILRVHDVRAVKDACHTFTSAGGVDGTIELIEP